MQGQTASKPTMAAWIRHAARTILHRLYALAILVVVVWASYAAVAYLFRSVFTPAQLPLKLHTWAGDLHVETLRPEAAGTPQAPRAPIGHYHGVNRWFQPDPHNGCTARGCHEPLPHTKRKEVRAFANLHATFLDCGTCHDAGLTGPVEAVWVDTTTGRAQEPPAMLRLLRELERSAGIIKDQPEEIHPTILEQLREVIVVIGGDPVLEYLLVRLDTAEPGSPVWRHSVDRLRSELPAHARGEYGAKLTLRGSVDDTAGSAEQTKLYLEAAANSRRKQKLYEAIHANIVAKPGACLACHGDQPPRLDFALLGYPPDRATYLLSSPVARLIQRIEQGETFHVPTLLEGGDAP